MKNENTWVIIPARNEKSNIARVIKGVKKYTNSVIVVDDGSNDDTYAIAKSLGCIALRHIVNLGKGAALKTGCDYAVKTGAINIVVIDADAQHDPKDIPRFLDKLKKNDIVFSYRKLNSKMPVILRFGNWFISRFVDVLYGVSLRDTQSGFRAFSVKAYKKIRWSASDYSMESEMIARAGKHKLKYTQIPIQTVYSDKYKGTTVIDGIKIVLNMVFWRITKRNA